ncbi:hypothetical protein DMR30_09610 [Klebsiella variicola]|nr:hypothetical protein DMR30_09610 [Klebsiella variicola]PXL56615.1 hypothetical protein DMS35_09760 [Klebsiella variicola]THG63361.1 hypothetical protein E5980_15135 [Klebsiella variicola]
MQNNKTLHIPYESGIFSICRRFKNTRSTELRKLSIAVIYVLLHHYFLRVSGLKSCAVGRGLLASR